MKRLSAFSVRCLFACLFILIFASLAQASGFALYEWSNRGNGMGGSMVGLADDPSALAYNPSGITQLEGTHSMVGVSFIAPTAKVDINGQTYDTKQKVYTAPHAYLTHQVSDRVSFGLGIYSRFGVGTNYDENWGGTEITGGGVYKASVEAFSAVPTMALKLTDNWSVAGGIEIMRVAFDQRLRMPHPTVPGVYIDAVIKNDGVTLGWNLSTLYKFNDQWSAGLVWRAGQKMVGNGSRDMHISTGAGSTENVSMTANLPASMSGGLAWRATENLTLDLDVVWTKWEDYRYLTYDYETSATSVKEKMWGNTWRVGLGGEYALGGGHKLRAGLVWDESPLQDGYEDFMLPTNDRQIVSLGYGFDSGSSWTLDMSAMYIMMAARDVMAGKSISVPCRFHDSSAWIAGVTLGYEF